MEWKIVEGTWRWPYRISDQGDIQKQLPNGKWKALKPYPYSGQLRVQMWVSETEWKRVQISKLVADAFMGGTPEGMFRIHKNGMMWDNAVENLAFTSREASAKRHRPGNSRPVLKLDREGNVVAIYRSGSEAARENFISQKAMSTHCRGLVEDPYRLDGYQYVYEEAYRGRPRRRA